jgi:hypothetical protein
VQQISFKHSMGRWRWPSPGTRPNTPKGRPKGRSALEMWLGDGRCLEGSMWGLKSRCDGDADEGGKILFEETLSKAKQSSEFWLWFESIQVLESCDPQETLSLANLKCPFPFWSYYKPEFYLQPQTIVCMKLVRWGLDPKTLRHRWGSLSRDSKTSNG